MKLLDHVLNIRSIIAQAMQNRFERLGLTDDPDAPLPSLTEGDKELRTRLKQIVDYHAQSTTTYAEARKKAVNECTFTLFNRLAAIKVMEDKGFFPEIIMRRDENGKRSFEHNAWLEENPESRNEEREGLLLFFLDQFDTLSKDFPIFSKDHPYALMPRADELNEIIDAINAVSADPDCGEDIWRGDDILGWLYENFNSVEKHDLKESGAKTEYDKVSLQSQVYTPQWVVKFLVDNTVGKMYLEMFPESNIDREQDPETGEIKYRIANRPSEKTRKTKALEKWRIIDPACGSGNFLIYTMSLLYDLYLDQMENFGADYNKKEIPKLIIENNLYGVDLDERAVQLSQIALRIKARELGKKRVKMPEQTNIVSSNFLLPSYKESGLEEELSKWDIRRTQLVESIWTNLSNGRKFGSLIRVDEDIKRFEEYEENLLRLSMNDLFADQQKDSIFSFSNTAITVLRNNFQKHVATDEYSQTKFEDAVKFLSIINQKYDVAVANPPYTDSGDFGQELKKFIEENYKKPNKFHTNLYASFILRCCELASDNGKVGMIHPMTFMYIKSFEDVRKFILEKTHINIFVEYGLSNLFGSVMVDPAFYVLEKGVKEGDSVFMSYDQYTRTPEEKRKKEYCLNDLTDVCEGRENSRVYRLPQDKLRQIKSWPFIYWISDDFRKKFSDFSLSTLTKPISGFKTGNNEGACRHWWEVTDKTIWQPFTKGGEYNKWYGNNWLKINKANDFEYIKSQNSFQLPNIYGRLGINFTGSGSKGITYRLLEPEIYHSNATNGLFPDNPYLYLAFLNSPLLFFAIECLNPTVNKTVGDVSRLPFIDINELETNKYDYLTDAVKFMVSIKKHLCQFSLIEPLFKQSPIQPGEKTAKESIAAYFSYENALLTQVLLNEAIINREVFDIYELSENDRKMVLDKEGIPVGDLSVSEAAKNKYLDWLKGQDEFPASDELLEHIQKLPLVAEQRMLEFDRLYQSNYGWEEFCIQNHVNPIEAWYQFAEWSKCDQNLPAQRTQVLAFELITDVIRTLLEKDDDGVMPLVDRTGEGLVADRIHQEMIERGYTPAQISQVCQLLGMPLDRYLLNRFFQQLSDHLNLFMYLPKTPFIWHLTSGQLHAMELYVSIYRWNRNTLSRVKSVYCANRESALRDRLATLAQSTDSAAQSEAADIRAQLRELGEFTQKLDELLASGYDPKLDDGVGKNIAPLQKAGLLSYKVLKETGGQKSQLNKFLNADW